MNQAAVTALMVGATAGWLAGLWMGSKPRRDRDPDWRRSFNHENLNRPSGPPPLKRRRSEPEERFIRMNEGPVQRSMGNNPTTPKPEIIPKPQFPRPRLIRDDFL